MATADIVTGHLTSPHERKWYWQLLYVTEEIPLIIDHHQIMTSYLVTEERTIKFHFIAGEF